MTEKYIPMKKRKIKITLPKTTANFAKVRATVSYVINPAKTAKNFLSPPPSKKPNVKISRQFVWIPLPKKIKYVFVESQADKPENAPVTIIRLIAHAPKSK
ncbi:MAG: hypothetical protein FWE17_00390 [Alphaproteobacteria bacterium]|nr:hypothetical protein [Alphaproteobacteria bacterium]MCL2758508.1 hypothetical protein [Alphaproteobacteria bacterium]